MFIPESFLKKEANTLKVSRLRWGAWITQGGRQHAGRKTGSETNQRNNNVCHF